MVDKKNAVEFIKQLDQEKNFFNGVEEINKYNLGAIVELIQYNNVKEYGEPLYTKDEIRRSIKKYMLDY
ncbi:MAG: hypothetical protein JJT76_13170 [Clostridiaceae bacterium]|nr:hypothetical protein [Clostridiaceae bacterium]